MASARQNGGDAAITARNANIAARKCRNLPTHGMGDRKRQGRGRKNRLIAAWIVSKVSHKNPEIKKNDGVTI